MKKLKCRSIVFVFINLFVVILQIYSSVKVTKLAVPLDLVQSPAAETRLSRVVINRMKLPTQQGLSTVVPLVRNSSSVAPWSLKLDQVALLSNPPPSNQTMNACLFIMDDTIRLLEWLAYHYTVLPLGHLVIAIDPKSKRIDKIDKILDTWREYITIDAYYNDSFLTLDPYEGWGRQVWGQRNQTRAWFRNKNGPLYRSQAHKRRQNFFSSFCFRTLYQQNKRRWTILTDTDEFITFNYRYPDTEDSTKYDSVNQYVSREEVERERAYNLPFRDIFANMTERITIAQYLVAYKTIVQKQQQRKTKISSRCIRIPGLTFSSHESNTTVILMKRNNDSRSNHDTVMDISNLMTMRQRQHAAKDGAFSKAMLNLQVAADVSWFQFRSVVNVHTPNRRMCGRIKKEDTSGSGADYISSLFRLHHFKAGSLEAYLERVGDWRGGGLWRFYFDRNVDPVGENHDLTPWFEWFVDKVGYESANRLLLQPLNDTYNEIGQLRHVESAKEKIAHLVPTLFGSNSRVDMKETTQYKRTNHTIGACMFIRDDTLRLMEWLAYHYTVLPLSHLILGLDPNSQRVERLDKIINIWQPFVKIVKYTYHNMSILDRFVDKNSNAFIGHEPLRRKNEFIAKCLRSMKDADHDWVLVADSDEFIIFNYQHPDEDPSSYNSLGELNLTRTEEDIDSDSYRNTPIRKRLPPLEEHVTIADFIHGQGREKCYLLPSLNFSAHQDQLTQMELPDAATLLLSLCQHRTAWKEENASNFILAMSQVDNTFLDQLVVGSAERFAEGGVGVTTAFPGADFINNRHFNAISVNNDVDYWINWFIKKVGPNEASRILFKPMLTTNKELSHTSFVKDLKSLLTNNGLLPKKESDFDFIDNEDISFEENE